MTRDELDRALLDAFAADDRTRIAALYLEAAGQSASKDEEGFFLTQAYVFSLETGSANVPAIKARLVELGRDR